MQVVRRVVQLSLLLVLASGPSAAAAPITIGQLAPGSSPSPVCVGGPKDIYQAALGSGTPYVVPPGYTRITSWNTNAAAGAGQLLKLKVYRLISGSTYLVVGSDGPHILTPSTVNTFPVSIAVQPGDLVGLNNENATTVNNACLFATGNSADAFGASASYGDAGDGTTESMNPVTSQLKLNVTATVAAVPTVSSVAPSSGSTTGGTSVTVAGRDFTGTTAVNFGAARARSFTVNSDGTINAVSPAASAGTVDVTVTTAVGTSPATAADRFTFVKPVKCVVPKLKGKTLKAARKALKKAHCKLGKIKGPKGKKARIKKQKPKAGTVLASGSKVRVTTKKRK